MNKYLVLSIFIAVFFYLLRKDRVYVVPMILLIFSNLNGLLDWEDFALQGVVKFQDYGLIITLMLLFFNAIATGKKTIGYERYSKRSVLYKAVLIYWAYYIFEFIYSMIIQGNLEWPIKMGRTFFYGLITFVIYRKIKPNPIVLFKKIIFCLKIATLTFGLLYVGYNLFDFEFYAKEAYEVFTVAGTADVKRNFAGFPNFTFYFLILFVHQLMVSNKDRAINFIGMMLMAMCVYFTLTRGAILVMVAVIAATILFRRQSASVMRRVFVLIAVSMVTIPFLLQYGQGQLEVMIMRFSEFADAGGATQSNNYLVRSVELSRIIDRVIDFNPLFGFGFTNVNELGYQSVWIHGGSPDNGFSNLIGVTGLFGLILFFVVIASWAIVNIKLQLLNKEQFSKVNFIFIIYVVTSMLNGSTMSYMHTYALFLVYDLLAYAYLKNGICADSVGYKQRIKNKMMGAVAPSPR